MGAVPECIDAASLSDSFVLDGGDNGKCTPCSSASMTMEMTHGSGKPPEGERPGRGGLAPLNCDVSMARRCAGLAKGGRVCTIVEGERLMFAVLRAEECAGALSCWAAGRKPRCVPLTDEGALTAARVLPLRDGDGESWLAVSYKLPDGTNIPSLLYEALG